MESWALCFGGKLKTLRAVKKPQLIFWNKISPGISGEKAGRFYLFVMRPLDTLEKTG
jgi:hypothetical protein